ncbi:hypothetical protein HYDPIDRAFT_117549 [Hydnomerulius pinastri MD-312]|uniref:Sm domain-containing protein n=1 Tax=Hydnomerulius pinastri MD-312 TaxID=994086 RepID=A0A0C9W9S1_9AGAM|nr:hypothetical protein HYDPIDRAFT_117549 [Hydnomerulius pinastri MD-312]
MSSPPSSDSVSSADSSRDTPAIAAVRELLKETLRIVTSDNRVFLGTFVGTDQLLNILMVNTEEYLLSSEESTGRYVGQVMIPWRLITQVEAPLRSRDEQGRRHNQNGGGLYM